MPVLVSYVTSLLALHCIFERQMARAAFCLVCTVALLIWHNARMVRRGVEPRE